MRTERKALWGGIILLALTLLVSAHAWGGNLAAKGTQPAEAPIACPGEVVAPAELAALAQANAAVPFPMTETFEGAWPGAWSLRDGSTTDGGEFLMGKRTCHPHAGSNAGWSVGGGAQGAGLSCEGTYPNNASTWAIYGPFSLVGVSSASLTYYIYGQSEGGDQCPYDFLFVGSSVDGTNYNGIKYCGNWTAGTEGNGYYRRTLDLSSRLGQAQVWIAFAFISDASYAYNGFHVDDITLSTAPATTPTPTVTPRPVQGRKVFLPVVQKNQRTPGGTLRDSQGKAVSELPRSEALYADFTGLAPRTQYDIRVLNPNGAEVTLSRFTTDSLGNIPTSALAYDLGLTMEPLGGAALEAANANGLGVYTVIILDQQGREVRRWTVTVREPTAPIVYASSGWNTAMNSFLYQTHSVFARGEYFNPGAVVDVYLVADRSVWTPGTPLADVSGGPETVTVGADGKFLVQIWNYPNVVGAYDVVVDVDRDGRYSAGDVVDSHTPVGLMVQKARQGLVQVQLACDYNRNYKDVFLTNENVYIYVNPPVQQFAHAFGWKYVVHHRDVWNDGDDLVDISEGPERDHPQYGCTNEGRVLLWPAPLTPGVYDVIFDINHNGKFDVNIDLLDNIDSFGNPTGGFFVPGAPGSPVVTITSPATGSSDPDGVITLEGTVTSATAITWAKWYVNAGNQSNSGNLSIGVDGRFSQQIYLFPGQNTVQVWVRNAAGTGTASIVVYSSVSGVWDIHAQVTWPTLGQDVDLHLLRPGGSRNSAGDCYYGNCRNEDRSRNPDWGLAGSADDNPRLDVDCTTQCNGPENITLNTLGRSQANGRYTVELLYYSDHGKGAAQPRVNVWVRGQLYTFGPYNLTNRQWVTVCYIDWPSGLVTPSGVISAHPLAAEEGSSDRFPPEKKAD